PAKPRPTRLAPRLARLLRFKGSVMGSLRPVFAVLLCAVAFLCGNARAAPEPQPFGPGSLEAIRLAHQGRAFILSLWSVSCEPCRHEMPVWRALQAKHPGLRVVLVSTDPPTELDRIKRFL